MSTELFAKLAVGIVLVLEPLSMVGQVELIEQIRVPAGAILSATGAVKMLYDSSGSLYVAGQTHDGGLVAIKVSADGQIQWQSPSYTGSATPNDRPAAIAVHDASAFYVAATSKSANDDYVVLKYDGSGQIVWTNWVNGNGNGDDFATALTTDSEGNVYVTGATYLPPTSILNYAITTASYGAGGALRWRHDHAPGFAHKGRRVPHSILADKHGRVLVSCLSIYYSDPRAPAERYQLLAYEAGTGSFTIPYETQPIGGGATTPAATLLCIAPNEDVVFAGGSYVNRMISRLSWDLTPLPIAYRPREGLSGLAVDGSGNAYVGTSAGRFDVTKYNPANTVVVWNGQYNGPSGQGCSPNVMHLDENRNVFVAGTAIVTNNHLQWVTVKFGTNGALRWSALFGSETSSNFQPHAMRSNREGQLLVAGTAPGAAGGTDLIVLKYSDRKASIAIGTNGLVHLEFVVAAASTNTLQMSSDLINWTGVMSQVADPRGVITFDIPLDLPIGRMFYRTVSQ